MVAPTGIVVKNVAGFAGAALRATDGRPYGSRGKIFAELLGGTQWATNGALTD